MIKSMGMEYSSGLMEEFMRGCGNMENRMALESTTIILEEKRKGNGKKDRG